jgi:hypothetical protein
MIQRPDVDELLKHNGEYLLRKTEANGQLKTFLVNFRAKIHFLFLLQDKPALH